MAVGDKKYKNSQKRKDAFISTFIGLSGYFQFFGRFGLPFVLIKTSSKMASSVGQIL
ncbi:MAG: hypothetical protein RL390_1182 [Actinomycetota bacterium]